MISQNRLDFPAFPFKPYPIQLQLMSALYDALQIGGVAIVESPTGTGKTLSLICSVLQWLHDQRSSSDTKNCEQSTGAVDDGCEPAWMRDFSDSTMKPPKLTKYRVVRKKKMRKDSESRRAIFSPDNTQDDDSEKLVSPSNSLQSLDDDESFLLDDYDSYDESNASAKVKRNSSEAPSSSSGEISGDEEQVQPQKVFFCSRTHSQLSQFIKELQRTTFATSLKTVCMGSRKSLCINPGKCRRFEVRNTFSHK